MACLAMLIVPISSFARCVCFRHTGSTKHPKTDPAHRLPKRIFIFIHLSKNALSLINFPRSQHFVFIHFRKNASNNIAGRPRSQQRSPRRGQRPPDPPFFHFCVEKDPRRKSHGQRHTALKKTSKKIEIFVCRVCRVKFGIFRFLHFRFCFQNQSAPRRTRGRGVRC